MPARCVAPTDAAPAIAFERSQTPVRAGGNNDGERLEHGIELQLQILRWRALTEARRDLACHDPRGRGSAHADGCQANTRRGADGDRLGSQEGSDEPRRE